MTPKKQKVDAPKPRTLAVRLSKYDNADWLILMGQYRNEVASRLEKRYDTTTAKALAAEKTDADLLRALVKHAFDNIPDFVSSILV